MKLLFKQKMFSWFGSYDVFDETGDKVYTVKGKPSWGRAFKFYDKAGTELGMIKQKVFSLLPRFFIYYNGEKLGEVNKKFTFVKPQFDIDFNGWKIEGDWCEWDYKIIDEKGGTVAEMSKKIWRLTDTYEIDVKSCEDALMVLMLVTAIDAEKFIRENA